MVFDTRNDIADHNLGLHEVVIRTELFGAFFVFGLAKSREHNDAHISRLRRIAEHIEYVKAVYLWHHDIENDEVWAVFEGVCERIFAVIDVTDIKAFHLKAGAINSRECSIVFNEQNFLFGFHTCISVT